MLKIKIMVVEDKKLVAVDIKEKLHDIGYSVVCTASSGEEAIQRATEAHLDLIIMDIKLSGAMDGIEAAGKIRERFDIPVIYLTAHGDEDTLKRAKITEPFGYLLKPVNERALYSTIELAIFKNNTNRLLKEKEEQLRALFENSPDAILLIDLMTARIIEANPQAGHLFSVRSEDVFELDLFQAHPCYREKRSIESLDSHSHEHNAIESCISFVNGKQIPVEIFCKTIFLNNSPALLTTFRDITDRKKREKEIVDANEIALKENRAKCEFLAKMSHEIRIPMNGIIGMSELILQTGLNRKQQKYMEMLKFSAEGLIDIINDILDISKAEASGIELDNIEFDFVYTIENTCE